MEELKNINIKFFLKIRIHSCTVTVGFCIFAVFRFPILSDCYHIVTVFQKGLTMRYHNSGAVLELF